MQRAPDDGDASILHLLQIAADLTKLLLGKGILCRTVHIDLRGIERGGSIVGSRRTGIASAGIILHLPVPHSTHQTAFRSPFLHTADVAVVQPSLGIDILRGMEIDKVVGIDGRIVACPFIDLLCLFGIPVHVGRCTGDHLIAVE